MTPKILDGKLLSQIYQDDIRTRVETLKARSGRVPGLGVILVGDNPASKVYVNNKSKLAKGCGLETFDARLPASASMEEVAAAIRTYNQNPQVHGILLQLPLPPQLDQNELISLIDPKKDADGLHPINQGLLMRGEGKLRPCTPQGSMRLIDLAYSPYDLRQKLIPASSIAPADLKGKTAIVIGRSILVGKPLSLLLLERNATVWMAHSKTADLPKMASNADIVIGAVGVPKLVKGSWVKEGAVVIDVGINRLPDGSLCGDIDFNEVSPKCHAITPVPGGVGPMTVVMLIHNTVESALGAE